MMPVIDPETGNVLCWCGLVHLTLGMAELCSHQSVPYTPGDPAMRRPSYVPERSRYVPGGVVYRPAVRRRWLRILSANITAVLFVIVLVLIGLQWAERHPGHPATVPTTYAPPAATGGPVHT